MTVLSDAIPRDKFAEMFSVVEEKITARERTKFYRDNPTEASTVNLFCWDEAVARGVVSDGQEMKQFHPHDLAGAYRLTKSRIGEDPFKEVFCTEFYNEHSKQLYFGRKAKFAFAEIDLVHCYPNDLHISDVTLLDLTRPVRDTNSVAPRTHGGLHAFPVLLDGLLNVARQKGIERLSLVAASPAAHAVFTRYGFEPTDTPVSQYAFQNFGYSHAMARPID